MVFKSIALALILCATSLVAHAETPSTAYQNLEAHIYNQAPAFFGGDLFKTQGVYYTGTQIVRTEDGRCGVVGMRYITMHSLTPIPTTTNDTDPPITQEDLYLVPEIGTVFVPIPCEKLDSIDLENLKNQL